MMWKYFFYMWPIKKKWKKMPNQCHVREFAKLDEGGGYSEKKNYEDTNLTENFIGVKTGNDIYYRGEKHY